MTDPNHELAMQSIGLAARILTPQADQLAALIKAEQAMHGSLHVTDPTLYQQALNSKGLEQQVKLARAGLAFVLAVQEVKAELADAESN